MEYFFALKNFTDNSLNLPAGMDLEHEVIAKNFMQYLKDNYSDDDFCKLLACAGFIPDLYLPDSSEETLFSKLTEILVAEWANRMNFNCHIVKAKAGYEDISIEINDNVIVCDAKSFRLGRSQIAPNVKDFVKPADITKWLDRHDNGLGGLVTYPDTHDWIKGSDVYLYCTDKECPIVILAYTHLAALLHFRDKYSTNNLVNLWDYGRLFPARIPKNVSGGNKKVYWNTIEHEIVKILDMEKSDFSAYLKFCKDLQFQCIEKNVESLRESKEQIITKIKMDCAKLSAEELRRELSEYKIKVETKKIDEFIDRIFEFRLNRK